MTAPTPFRPRARVLVVAALASLSLTSCSYFLGPDDELNAEVTFSASPDAGQDLPDSASIAVEGDNIAIIGAITTVDACREINGAGEVTSNRIRITIRAESVAEACDPDLGRFDYEVVIADLKSGLWTVEVRHLQYGTGAATFIAGKPVIVP
jgi:hypothetical protein